MNRWKNEDDELLKLVGQPATRENMRLMRHGGSVGADGTIKSVITRTEMERQRLRCPRYYRKRYLVVGIFTGIFFLGFTDLFYLVFHPPVLYQPIIPDGVLVNNVCGAVVAAFFAVFIYDLWRNKNIKHRGKE